MKGNEYDPSFGTNRRLLLDGSLRIVEILDNAGQEEYGLVIFFFLIFNFIYSMK